MLKREITYTDYDDNVVTDVYYFNLTKSEILDLEVEHENGLEATIKRIVETKDRAGLVREFKRIILLAYGEKSEDGKRFIKTQALRDNFVQTAGYDALFMELATDDQKASEFFNGVIPKDLAQEAEQERQRRELEAKTSQQFQQPAERPVQEPSDLPPPPQ